MVRVLSCLLAAVVAGAAPLALGTPSLAQPRSPQQSAKKPAKIYRTWDGTPITRNCNAAPRDLAGFKATILAHVSARIGFSHKMQTGFYRWGAQPPEHLRRAPGQEIVRSIQENLQRHVDGGRTAALVYDIGLAAGQYSVCIWLVTEQGVEAAMNVALPNLSFSSLVQSGLDVTRRAEARAPHPLTRPSPAQAAGAIADQATGWGAWGKVSGQEKSPEDTLRRAGNVLLPAPIAAALVRLADEGNVKRLLILPAADLGSVPFAALPLGGGHLIDRFAVIVLAEVDGLYSFPHDFKRTLEGDASALVVGDPDFSWDRNWKFGALPFAREEAETVARALGAAAVLGDGATRSRVSTEIEQRWKTLSLLYFATHGVADPVDPLKGSFLALNGEHLYADQIRWLQLRRQPLVVMSACQSGLGKVFEGGVFGLARAWFSAGATQVVMSLWNVNDAATKALMVRFMEQLTAGEHRGRPEYALQEAMRFLKNSDLDPAHWAAFTLCGLSTPSVWDARSLQ